MKKILTCLTILLFAAIGLIAGSAYYIYSQWGKPSALAKPVLLEIPKGYGAAQIGTLLQRNGIVGSARSFKWWCRFHNEKSAFKAGWYNFAPHKTFEEIAELISSGKTATIRVTIPEGRATWEIAGLLSRSPLNLDSAKLDSLMHSREFASLLGVEQRNLEGYLLPNTYDFPIGTTDSGAVKILVRANLKLRDELQAQNSPIWKELGNWHRILTLASVVEEETGLPDERPHIAGVFLNRLRLGMPLGADPTVRFIFRNLTGPIYKSQLNSDSPYNTRKFAGLMPGAISNPGALAIEAVLFPLQTDDLYFVAKDNGSREHFFSKTLSDHNSYKDVAKRNRGDL
ncbi:cell division protein YceG [Fibrobacterales bacterium]|nr:cell division protein YceG [Fibrobacterales bacterium]